jgi:hypothetical protein
MYREEEDLYNHLSDSQLDDKCREIDWAETLTSKKEWKLLEAIKNRQIKKLANKISYITLTADVLDEKYIEEMNNLRCIIRNWKTFESEIKLLLNQGIACREGEGPFGEIKFRKELKNEKQTRDY